MVQFNGHYDGRTITPDEFVDIPVNVPLRITIEPARAEIGSGVDWQQLLDLANECSVEGPVDLAERHDHYAHGKPRSLRP
jgi:hypothetical protein